MDNTVKIWSMKGMHHLLVVLVFLNGKETHTGVITEIDGLLVDYVVNLVTIALCFESLTSENMYRVLDIC